MLPLRASGSNLPASLPGNAGLMERCHDNCIYSHKVDAQEQHNKGICFNARCQSHAGQMRANSERKAGLLQIY